MTSKRKNKEAWALNGFEEWGGYMAAKKAKLDEQFQERAVVEFENNSTIFQGICIFVNGYTKPSADELRLLMMKHNGVYHHYLRPRVTTHVIASNLPYSKIMMHKKSQNPLPICKPEWIIDSIKAGKLLNYQDYLLYSQHTKTQPKLAFAALSAKASTDLMNNESAKIPADITKNSKINLPPKEPTIPSTLNSVSKPSSPAKEKASRVANSSKNPEFLSEFYNNSRLHHISTMGAVFKDYINELRDKSDNSFSGLERLKNLKKRRKDPEPLDRLNSDSEEDFLDSSIASDTKKQDTVIMHIDMDCFFVSVGLRNRPQLKGLPVAVTHAKGGKTPQNGNTREIEIKMYKQRFKEKSNKTNKVEEEEDEQSNSELDKHYDNCSLSEIASCSYEARKAGIKNGMFLGQALKLCPDLKTIPYDFDGYKEVSYALYDTIAKYTLNIEAVSCDELYADCTKIIVESGLHPLEFAEIIRKEITEKTGCPVSTGFGKNKLQARLATKKAKPNGQFYLESKNVEQYISAINVRDLPGVGTMITHKLNKIGVHTCVELQSVSLCELQKELGKKTGEMLHNMCRGIDNSKLNLEHVRKSVSAEVNYGIRFETMTDAEKFLKQLCEEVCSRLNKANVKGRCVTLKLMIRSKNAPVETAKYMGHGFCDHFTRSKNLISPINSLSIITKEVLSLWHQLQQVPEDVRGVGIQISRLESTKKSGSSDLMSFINKAKLSKAENEQNNPSRNNLATEPKPIESNDFLVVEKFPFQSTITEKSNNGDVFPSTSGFDKQHVSSSRVRVQGEEFMMNNIEKCVKNTAPSSSNSHNQATNQPLHFNRSDRDSRVMNKESELPNDLELQAVDESVLAELPEDIRNEIINASKKSQGMKIKNKQENPSLIQKKQDSYFKELKKNVERPKKSEMPPIQEVDLAFLLELPDDIRNEILNEYRDKVNESKSLPKPGCSLNTAENAVQNKAPVDEVNISISQVDPEVLAVLPEDIQKDVKDYCASKKLENKSSNSLIPKQSATNTNKLIFNQKNIRQVKPKVSNIKNNKIVKNKKNSLTNTKSSKQSPVSNHQTLDHDLGTLEPQKSDTAEIKNAQENLVENIKSSTTAPKCGDPGDQQSLMELLVEEFMSLSLKEVKFQIQRWISTSDSVNKVDFLAFSTFLSRLPKEKRIEDLHILLKTMHRCVEKTKLCVWHRAYRKTKKMVQCHMLATYDSSLMAPSIECENLDCRNNEHFLNDEI